MGRPKKVKVMNPIRQEAIDKNELTYIPKNPCRRGHFLCYTSTGQCKLCINENYNKNRDKRLARMRNYNFKKQVELIKYHSKEYVLWEIQMTNLVQKIRWWNKQPNSHKKKANKLLELQREFLLITSNKPKV